MSTWIATDLLKLKLYKTAVGGWHNMQIYFMLAVQWIIGMILKVNSNMHSIWFCCDFNQSVSVQLEYMQAASLLPVLQVTLTQLWNINSHTEFSVSHSHSFVPATIWLLGNCAQLYCKYWKYTSCPTIVSCNCAFIWWSLCGTWIW
jgi:hypothetical protein